MINLTPNSFNPGQQAAPAAVAADAPADAGIALPFAELLGQLAEAIAPGAEPQPPLVEGADNAQTEPAEPEEDAGTQPATAGAPPLLLAAMMAMAPPPVSAAQAAAASAAADDLRLGAPARPAPRGEVELPAPVAGATAPPNRQAAAVEAKPLPAQALASPAPLARLATDTGAAPAEPAARPASLATAVADASPDAGTRPETAAAPRDAVTGIFATPAPAAPQGGERVALAGPPTAWRQGLHEALGERLDLQLGNRMEQAVIRLDPPQLGRIEIAIRHSEGSLQVTLTATHGEVLRQLQAVSDNLRADLAQRQYTEVAVTVAPAPRQAGATPFGADSQGRGRQPGREHDDQAPGLALLDAGAPASGFSMTGRE
jgi:flagellar hook-length control protein FliK